MFRLTITEKSPPTATFSHSSAPRLPIDIIFSIQSSLICSDSCDDASGSALRSSSLVVRARKRELRGGGFGDLVDFDDLGLAHAEDEGVLDEDPQKGVQLETSENGRAPGDRSGLFGGRVAVELELFFENLDQLLGLVAHLFLGIKCHEKGLEVLRESDDRRLPAAFELDFKEGPLQLEKRVFVVVQVALVAFGLLIPVSGAGGSVEIVLEVRSLPSKWASISRLIRSNSGPGP